jgi:hypothetical protein
MLIFNTIFLQKTVNKLHFDYKIFLFIRNKFNKASFSLFKLLHFQYKCIDHSLRLAEEVI